LKQGDEEKSGSKQQKMLELSVLIKSSIKIINKIKIVIINVEGLQPP